MLVIARPGQGQSPEQWANFMRAFSRFAERCGVAVEVANGGQASAEADAVLRMKQIGSLRISSYGIVREQPASLDYDAVVVEQPSGRAVWRGQFSIGNSGLLNVDHGTRSADALGQQLVRDGTLRGCPTATTDVQNGPRQVVRS